MSELVKSPAQDPVNQIFAIRDKDSFAYARAIEKPYGVLNDVLAWCRTEIKAEWRWQMVEMSTQNQPGRYIFYFDDGRDCLAFALKWC